jgi:hypothetical protein
MNSHETLIGAAESWLLAFAGRVAGIDNVNAADNKPMWLRSQADERITSMAQEIIDI